MILNRIARIATAVINIRNNIIFKKLRPLFLYIYQHIAKPIVNAKAYRTVLVTDITMSANDLATKLVEQIKNNTAGSGVTASASAAVITIDAEKQGDDYEIIGADLLMGTNATVTTAGAPAYGDAAYVSDLVNKAAADAGFEYTFYTWTKNLYPNYPLNPLKATNTADTGFTIFTLRFAEPRDVKTRDEVVNQIVQVAFPTGATGIAAFETACKALAGEAAGGE